VPLVTARVFALLLPLALAGCAAGSRPVDVRDGDTCANCRMTISNVRVAAQIAVPGEEPLFYDDIGCLAHAIAAGRPREFAYVAEHRTRAWVPAAAAVYSRVPALATPMGSHIVAHADEASRNADPPAAGGTIVPAAEVFAAREGEHDGA
jgi:copper chaperone NosL